MMRTNAVATGDPADREIAAETPLPGRPRTANFARLAFSAFLMIA
jgi:hypothetical protein